MTWATPAKQLPAIPACRLCSGTGRTRREGVDLHGRTETSTVRCRCTDLDRCEPCECGTCDDPYIDQPTCWRTFRCLSCRARKFAQDEAPRAQGHCDTCAPTVGVQL